MKRIEAIVRTGIGVVDEIRCALDHAGNTGMTVWEVRGHGRQKGQTAIYRGAEYQLEFVPKSMIIVYVQDDMVDSTVDAIRKVADSGNIGDGVIAVSDVQEVVRVRTGEALLATA